MQHGIQVQLGASIGKYKSDMDAAKSTTRDSMGVIASLVDKVKSMFSGLWNALKSFFSGTSDGAKSSFGSMSDSANGAFQKIAGYLPGFHSDLDKTRDKMGETEEKSSSLARKIETGLVAAFIAVTATASLMVAKGLSIDATFASMAISSDIAVSQISRFDATAARSGVSIKDLGASVAKFRDEMNKAAAGDGSSEFDKLGVKVADSNNALRDTDAVMIDVAKKIALMSSEAEKYAAASKVGFDGKAQVLEDIAHASNLSASVTDEQAAAVVRLGKIWHEILPSGKSMWTEISEKLTNALTPAMTGTSVSILESKNRIVDAFNQIYGGGSMFDKLAGKIRDWSKDASQWFADVERSSTNMTISIMKFIAAKTGLGNADAFKPTGAGYVPGPVKLNSGNNAPVLTDAEKEAQKQYAATTKSINEKIAAQKLEAQTGETLTDGQRMAIQMMVALRDGTLQLTDAQKVERTGQLQALIDQEKANKLMLDGKAAAEAASKKQQETYTRIMSIVDTRLDQQNMELLSNQNLTDSQKLILKLNNEVRNGQIQLTQAGLAELRVKLPLIAANDKLVQSQKSLQEVTKYVEASAIARDKQNAALAVEYSLYGKSADARAIAMVAVDAETWKEQELAKLRADKLPIDDAIIARLNKERDLRTEVGQATLGQTQALQYAAQLEQENKRYAAEQLVDASASKQALLQIDVDLWKERIKNAGAGTEAQRLLQMNFSTWYANQAAQLDPWYGVQQSLKQYGREASDVGSQIGNAMANGFRGAEDAFASFVTTGKLNFSSLATSIIADLARIQAKQAMSGIVSYLGSAIGDYFGGISSAQVDISHAAGMDAINQQLAAMPHRANGGSVVGGMPYVVGEHGEEVFTPSSNGSITPNHALGGNGGGTININLTTNVSDGGTSSQSSGDSSSNMRAAADALNVKVKAVIAQETRQGGIIWKLQQGRA